MGRCYMIISYMTGTRKTVVIGYMDFGIQKQHWKMRKMSVNVCILSFFLYSLIGWFYESTVCLLLKERRLINRSFLLGPYCPVYGCGAVLCYLLLGSIENPFMLFLSAAVLCSVLEYVTGYGMEKLFQAKWWDYSHLPLNLHGRICLYGAVFFGTANVLICKKIQPRIVANKRGIDVWVSDKKTQFKKRELRFLYAFPKLKIKSRDMLMRKVELRGHIKKVFRK